MHEDQEIWQTCQPNSSVHHLSSVHPRLPMGPHGDSLGCYLRRNVVGTPHSECGCVDDMTSCYPDGRPFSFHASTQTLHRPCCKVCQSVFAILQAQTYLQILHHRPVNGSTFPSAVTNLTLIQSENTVSRSFVLPFLVFRAGITFAECSLPSSSNSCMHAQCRQHTTRIQLTDCPSVISVIAQSWTGHLKTS